MDGTFFRYKPHLRKEHNKILDKFHFYYIELLFTFNKGRVKRKVLLHYEKRHTLRNQRNLLKMDH